MKDNEHINDHLKHSLNEYSVQPRSSSFDAVLQKMEKKRKRRFFFLLFPGLLFLTGVIGLFVFRTPSPLHTDKTILTEKEINDPLKNKVSRSSATQINQANQSMTPNAFTQKERQEKASKEPTPAKPTNQPVKRETRTDHTENTPSKKIVKPDQYAKGDSITTLSLTKEDQFLKNSPSLLISDTLINKTAELIKADELKTEMVFLPYNEKEKDLVLNEIHIEPASDKFPGEEEKRIKFLIGPGFNPQIGSYQFSRGGYGGADAYLKNKRNQNKVSFNYGFGLKLGLLIKNKWELLLSFGLQKYTQKEKIINGVSGPTFSYSEPLIRSGKIDRVNPGQILTNQFKYFDYSAEVNKIYLIRPLMKIKVGVGLHVQQLRTGYHKSSTVIMYGQAAFYGYDQNLSSRLYGLNLKAGWIEDLNKRIQFQVCPNFFYSLNSMFRRIYFIKQRTYGLGLECLLLFKI